MAKHLYRYISILLAVLGLAGLFDDIIVWKHFFQNIVSQYENVRNQLLSIIPIEISDDVKDYLVLSIAAFLAFKLSASYQDKYLNRLRTDEINKVVKRHAIMGRIIFFPKTIFDLVLYMIFWPFVVIHSVFFYLKNISRTMSDDEKKISKAAMDLFNTEITREMNKGISFGEANYYFEQNYLENKDFVKGIEILEFFGEIEMAKNTIKSFLAIVLIFIIAIFLFSRY